MSRPIRIEFPGALYHVTSCGNEKKTIFRDDQDRELFLKTLARVNERYHWYCHAYCLMDNHYHLLIETPEGNLSLGMRQLNGVYTQTFNKRHTRIGHLFQGRYKAILIQKDTHLLEVSRYIVLNPVRGEMVVHPGDWRWSSYLATAGKADPHACLTTGWILRPLGRVRSLAEKRYQEFVKSGIGSPTIWTKVKGQIFLGEKNFLNSLSDRFKKHKHTSEIPKSQRYANRPPLKVIFAESILRDKLMRSEKIREAVEKHGYTQRAVADHIGVHFSYVSRIIDGR